MSEDADAPDNGDATDATGPSENATTADSSIPPDPSPSAAPLAPEPAAPVADPPPPVAEPVQQESAGAPAKTDVGKRVVAALIDFGIASFVGFVPGIGQLLGAAYLVLRDGLELDFMNHRSIGKNVMKLHLHSVDDAPLDLMTSVKRNWIFALGPLVPLLLIVPILGWIMIPFVGFAAIALGITELILAITDADGRRLGDKWAGTMIVED